MPSTGTPANTLHFERYEFKYVIPEALTDAIRRFTRPYVVPDPHAVGRPGGRYTIRNLYLDTPRFDFYQACHDDAADRMKLRIRWYDARAEGPFFLEVKRKSRQVIVKSRVCLSRPAMLDALQGLGADVSDAESARNLEGFLGRALSTGAVPAVLSRYTREPYESAFANYARITFDREMCFQRPDGFDFLPDPNGWTYVDGGWSMRGVRCATILELKFTAEFPRWMSDLVQEFGLERVGYSKYVSSIDHQRMSTWGAVDAGLSPRTGA